MVEFKIKKVFATYAWRWNIEDEMCGICQQGFEMMCPDCKHPTQCIPCIGTCGHAFHHHCVQTWTKNGSFCPMCRLSWEVKKMFAWPKSLNKK